MNGAIQTEYKGHLFRSRLEARWAVFFDVLGLEWKYEEQGYEVGEHRYLPDFWLPAQKMWAEVKGDRNWIRGDHARMKAILGAESPLPGFSNGDTSLILLGDVPEPQAGTVLHPLLTWNVVALRRTWGLFLPSLPDRGSMFLSDRHESWVYALFNKKVRVELEQPDSDGWDPAPWLLACDLSFRGTNDAYRAARQARFEHGATGR